MPARKSLIPPCTAPFPLEPLSGSVEAVSQDFERYQFYHLGRLQGCPAVYTYQSLAWTLRDRIMSDWMNSYAARDQPGKRRGYYLSLEFLIGRSLSNHVLNLGLDESSREALQRFGQTSRNGGRGGRRCRAGQRRPRSAGCVFHGQLRHAEPAGDGLRPALRVRHVPPAHRKRLSEGRYRPLAARRQPVGSRALGIHPPRAVRRAHRALPRQGRHRTRALGRYQRCAGHSLRHADFGLSQPCGEHVAAVEGRSHRRVQSG